MLISEVLESESLGLIASKGLTVTLVCFCHFVSVLFSVRFSLFNSKPRHWLGRTSPKWPIFVSSGTLHFKSVNRPEFSVELRFSACCLQPHSMMACHINWHSAVYHVEKANYDAALDIFDNQVGSLLLVAVLLELLLACSLFHVITDLIHYLACCRKLPLTRTFCHTMPCVHVL